MTMLILLGTRVHFMHITRNNITFYWGHEVSSQVKKLNAPQTQSTIPTSEIFRRNGITEYYFAELHQCFTDSNDSLTAFIISFRKYLLSISCLPVTRSKG